MLPLRRVLVANRGEIALRVICACRELGLQTVAVYSEIDADALHVRAADRSVCIGPAPASRSYLNVSAIVSAMVITGADAVHPGYGFLSERPEFAEAVAAAGGRFIGPRPDTMRLLGDKMRARETMARAGLPVLPGTIDPLQTVGEALAAAERLGYPLMIKASGGGGGKGMRAADDADELRRTWTTAQREAEATCGDGTLYLERWLESARHVEFQILADQDGKTIHLGDRECSIQRRHQKLVEESPSGGLQSPRRESWGEQVVEAARTVGYLGVGTFEFLVDGSGDPFFLEVNPRLQVEHAVTEMVTGVDLVKEQIRVAAGEPLSVRQSDISWSGHAIECRIVAESAETLRPSAGTIRTWQMPGGPGIRVDAGVAVGSVVSPAYDSLLAKVIAWGWNRDEAVARMQRALGMTRIEGVETILPLHQRMLADPDFLANRVSTRFAHRFGAS